MDITRAMVQVIMWSVFVVAVLSVFAAWYLLIGLVTLGIAIAAYWVRKRNAQKAVLTLSPVEDGSLSSEQSTVTAKAGHLQLPEGKELRVVETHRYNENHEWLAAKYQVENAENLVVDGLVLAGAEWIEEVDEGLEKEVLYVVCEEKVLGQIPDVDIDDWYDQILEVGGAARCNLWLEFNADSSLSRVRVRGYIGNL